MNSEFRSDLETLLQKSAREQSRLASLARLRQWVKDSDPAIDWSQDRLWQNATWADLTAKIMGQIERQELTSASRSVKKPKRRSRARARDLST